MQGRPFKFLADSGATVNLLSKKDFDLLKPTLTLQLSSEKISAYGSHNSTPVLEIIDAVLDHANTRVTAVMCVVSGTERPILSWKVYQALKLLTAVNHV